MRYRQLFFNRVTADGFALPTVLISAVIMMIVLVSGMSASGEIETALKSQYYNQLAREAAESGITVASACLRANAYTPTWSDSMPLYPNTSCSGGAPCTDSSGCFLSDRNGIRTTFKVAGPVGQVTSQQILVTGTVQLLKTSDQTDTGVWKTFTASRTARVGINVSFNTVTFGYYDTAGGTPGGGAYYATIAADGTLKMAGDNAFGNLGNGTTTSTLVPTPFILPAGVRAAGVYTNFLSQGNSVFVIGTDGKVYGAGRNNIGQLGDGTRTNRATPVVHQLPGGATATSVALNENDTYIVTSDGNVYASGACSGGQLGSGYAISGCSDALGYVRVALPTYSASDPNTHPTSNMVFDASTGFILMEGGRVYGWGNNGYGQLGNGNTTSMSTPIQVGTFGNPGQPKAVSIAFDGDTLYVVDDQGNAWATGRNTWGELGNGTTTDSSTLVNFIIPAAAGKAIKVTTDQWFASVLTDGGKVYSAGLNDSGQLGNGSTNNKSTPVPFELPTGVKAVGIYTTSTGTGSPYSNTFVVGDDGKVYGAGKNTYGQLGDGTKTDAWHPTVMNVIDGVNVKAAQVQSGLGTTVILTQDRKVYTVGHNNSGQLGDGTTTDSSTPAARRYTNILPVTIF